MRLAQLLHAVVLRICAILLTQICERGEVVLICRKGGGVCRIVDEWKLTVLYANSIRPPFRIFVSYMVHTIIYSERYELDLLSHNIAHLDCGVLREKIRCEF
jgi:hypothetical protein